MQSTSIFRKSSSTAQQVLAKFPGAAVLRPLAAFNKTQNQSEGVPSGIFWSLGAMGKGVRLGTRVCLLVCLLACLLVCLCVPGGSRLAGPFKS